MSGNVINEVVELHQFFQAWLSGSIEQSREKYDRFERVMADDFVMIPPDSDLLSRDVIMDIFWQEHGAKSSSFRIEIRNPVARQVAESLYLVSYEEWQFEQDQSARVTTALLRENPTGIEWLSVHESWLPDHLPGGV